MADVLYFAHNFEIQLISEEIKRIVTNLDDIELAFELKTAFPDNSSISLICKDNSGTLEVLHYEMVRLCYRKAIVSNYSSVFGENRAKVGRNYSTNKNRNNLMMRLYKAPYIFQEFKAHFSLLSNVAETDMDSIAGELAEILPKAPVKIGSICLLNRPRNSKYWEISDEIHFRRTS